MVCNEPLRPGQRLEPDCPRFSSNLSCESSSIFPNSPYGATGATEHVWSQGWQTILLKREEPLQASYSLLWRSVGNRVRPLRLEVKELLPPCSPPGSVCLQGAEPNKRNYEVDSFQQLPKQASCRKGKALFLCPNRRPATKNLIAVK